MEHDAAVLDADALDVTPRGTKRTTTATMPTTRAPSMSSVDTILHLPTTPHNNKPSPTRASSGHALEEPPTRRRPARRSKPVRMFQKMCRSLPVLTLTAPAAARCGGLLHAPSASATATPTASPSPSSSKNFLSAPVSAAAATLLLTSSFSRRPRRAMTGTLFGFRDGRVALALQENPRCRPALVVELALPTHALLRELSTTAGARIVLETEKRPDDDQEDDHGSKEGPLPLLEEPIWCMYCNGKRVGYAVRREPTEDDVAVLETLWAVSMGGGVLPGRSSSSSAAGVDGGGADVGEMAYMRGSFEHVIGSRDSESLYMVGPHGGDCPELAVFIVRL